MDVDLHQNRTILIKSITIRAVKTDWVPRTSWRVHTSELVMEVTVKSSAWRREHRIFYDHPVRSMPSLGIKIIYTLIKQFRWMYFWVNSRNVSKVRVGHMVRWEGYSTRLHSRGSASSHNSKTCQNHTFTWKYSYYTMKQAMVTFSRTFQPTCSNGTRPQVIGSRGGYWQ